MTGAAFWQMGGYALYVWSAYGVAALLLVMELAQLARRRRALTRRLSAMRRMDTETQ